MKREIVLHTEMTGLSAENGDKIVAVGAVELIDGKQTGKTFYAEINPLRPVSREAARIHELTDERLKDKPTFPHIAPSFLDFIGDYPLVVHNAPFDMAFLNAELTAAGFAPIAEERIVDTLPIAKRLFPEQRVNLDALCEKFDISLEKQALHGALLDAQLLGEVYVCLRKRKFEDFLKTGNINDIKRQYENEAHIYTHLITLLTRAVCFGRLDVCLWLINEKGTDVNAIDEDSWTPLMTAASFSNLSVVRYLVEHGADLHVKDNKNWTPLIWASFSNKRENVVKYLSEKTEDINEQTKDGFTALIAACTINSPKIISVLIANGADVNLADKDGKTPLMCAVEFNQNINAIKLLIQNGANVKMKDKHSKTVFDYLEEREKSEKEEIKRLLLNLSERKG